MSPEFSEHLSRMGNLIKEGKLPHAVIPRLFYCGHTLKYTKQKSNIPKYWCIDCQIEWEGKPKCPSCGIDNTNRNINDNENYEFEDKIWDITEEIVGWECKSCKHEWEGDDGTICPRCKKEIKYS